VIYTDTVPMFLIPLPKGNTAAFLYTFSLSDMVTDILLLGLVVLFIVQMWRTSKKA